MVDVISHKRLKEETALRSVIVIVIVFSPTSSRYRGARSITDERRNAAPCIKLKVRARSRGAALFLFDFRRTDSGEKRARRCMHTRRIVNVGMSANGCARADTRNAVLFAVINPDVARSGS